MNKTLIFIALCLTIVSSKSFFRPEQYEGSVRECAQCIKEAIPLAQQIKADFDARNITALINDGAAAFALYERASTDCDFSKEDLQFNLAKCLNDIRTLLPLIKQTQADFENRNLTALIDDGVAIYELVNKINEDCAAEARAIFEEEATLKAAEEIEIVNPVKCVKHALNFTSELKSFVRDERNHSLTPEQTFNEIWVLVNQVPEVFEDCGLPVPAFFNNTKALQNCTVALYDLYEDIVKIDNDINNKDITRVLEDVESIFKAANEIKAYCRASNFDLEEQQLEQVGGFAECVQSIETLVADVQKFEADEKHVPVNPEVLIDDTEAIWFALNSTLNHCGESEIADLIEQYVSDDCVEDVDAVLKKAYEIYEERDSALSPTHWRQFAQDVIEFVHDVQKVQDQCGPHNTTTLEAFHFEDYQFNITECLQQSELVAADLDTLIADVRQAKQDISPAEVEAITKAAFTLLDNILYDFVPACAGQAAEDDIDNILPEVCLNAIEGLTLLVEDLAEHEGEVRYIISALPQLYDDLTAITKNCETLGLFMKPFYRAVDNLITN